MIRTNENYKNKMLNFYKLYKNEALIYPIIKKISTKDTIDINSNEEIKYKYLVKRNLKKTLSMKIRTFTKSNGYE